MMRNIDHGVCYERILTGYLARPVRILELGAGSGEFTPPRRARQGRIWGVDPDERLNRNPHIDVKCRGRLEEMKFQDNFFDLICSRFMFEHLPDPIAALNTIYPWLKPGGKVLILTVNSLHYYHGLGRLLPGSWTSRITGRTEEDIFPAYYRFNNPFKIPCLIGQSKFGKKAPVNIIFCEKYLFSSFAMIRLFSKAYSLIVNSCSALKYFRAGLIIEISNK
ncbi:MAG: class I SAM-dependent methyltransferase [Sedimentisphaerales bacterium]|nr:class I SAM-dependent methyltransferase [Sedimentisphaerales bacterium]